MTWKKEIEELKKREKAKLNDFKLFFSIETPQGFACLIITVPLFFSKDLEIDRAEKISL